MFGENLKKKKFKPGRLDLCQAQDSWLDGQIDQVPLFFAETRESLRAIFFIYLEIDKPIFIYMFINMTYIRLCITIFVNRTRRRYFLFVVDLQIGRLLFETFNGSHELLFTLGLTFHKKLILLFVQFWQSRFYMYQIDVVFLY